MVAVFSRRVNLAVLHLRENGQLATLQKKWWQDKGECVGDDQKVSVVTVAIFVAVASTYF